MCPVIGQSQKKGRNISHGQEGSPGGARLWVHAEVLSLLFSIHDAFMTKACALSELAGPQEKTQCVTSTAYPVVFWDAKWQCSATLRGKGSPFIYRRVMFALEFLLMLHPFFPFPFAPNEIKASQPPDK